MAKAEYSNCMDFAICRKKGRVINGYIHFMVITQLNNVFRWRWLDLVVVGNEV